MDGHFVPNLSFGAPVIKCLKIDLLIDVHLMVTNPAERVDEFIKAGAKNITFHTEAVPGLSGQQALIDKIRGHGATAGIAVNPETPLEDVDDKILSDIDLLLIMSVKPGFGGQSFMSEVLEKVQAARAKFPELMIQMDGGIDNKTAPLCIAAGANNLVAGSFIFSAADRAKAISSLKS